MRPCSGFVRGSAVGFGAVPDRVVDEGVLRFFGEADAVVSDVEAELLGVALHLLDVSAKRWPRGRHLCSLKHP